MFSCGSYIEKEPFTLKVSSTVRHSGCSTILGAGGGGGGVGEEGVVQPEIKKTPTVEIDSRNRKVGLSWGVMDDDFC